MARTSRPAGPVSIHWTSGSRTSLVPSVQHSKLPVGGRWLKGKNSFMGVSLSFRGDPPKWLRFSFWFNTIQEGATWQGPDPFKRKLVFQDPPERQVPCWEGIAQARSRSLWTCPWRKPGSPGCSTTPSSRYPGSGFVSIPSPCTRSC